MLYEIFLIKDKSFKLRNISKFIRDIFFFVYYDYHIKYNILPIETFLKLLISNDNLSKCCF